MDDATFVSMVIGIAVIVLIGGLGLVMSKSCGSAAEDRLAGLIGGRKRAPSQEARPLQRHPGPARRRSTWGVLRSGRAWSPTPKT